MIPNVSDLVIDHLIDQYCWYHNTDTSSRLVRHSSTTSNGKSALDTQEQQELGYDFDWKSPRLAKKIDSALAMPVCNFYDPCLRQRSAVLRSPYRLQSRW